MAAVRATGSTSRPATVDAAERYEGRRGEIFAAPYATARAAEKPAAPVRSAGGPRLIAVGATDDEQSVADIGALWQVQVRELIEAGAVTRGELRALLVSLRRLADGSEGRRGTVRNTIVGGVHHGPVIQSGQITGLTLHTRHAPGPEEG
ncbi:hypothetical protein [Streptomyces sp. NBC_00582]|uniref:hypothetical protein n=1 Tax=Streptomyces sp. NBC_00582 TaxID=2975783 RepID=UPI0010633BB2|nr:hypothetical protein [Streptomyces sp. NBC_00582]WUB61344.1 hypothetical protein OG852_13590 [Streptomyces sp. NBC_00582]